MDINQRKITAKKNGVQSFSESFTSKIVGKSYTNIFTVKNGTDLLLLEIPWIVSCSTLDTPGQLL